LFRINDHRAKGTNRGLDDSKMVDAVATFVQSALFPSTPATAFPALDRASRVALTRRRRPSTQHGDRPGADQSSPTAQRILDAGAATLATRGYHATSVRDVLQAAGAGRGTFYRHFTDKSDLLVRLSQDCLGRLVELAQRFADAITATDEEAALRRWLEECLALHRRYRGVFRALLQEESANPNLQKLRTESGAAILQTFDDALARVERSHPFDVRIGSLLLLALLERGPDYQFGTTYDLDERRVVQVLACLVERGLLGRPPSRT
jgi:AcrR family transcriptional regulator